jgi:hypothetical protein
MGLIQNISSTLKTWAFKKKLLAFSGRFRWEPEACFYCPEMCRFSCAVAEATKHNAYTPRGKMSLLHLAERGYPAEAVAGSAENRLSILEQCTGCGRCTEYCVYEVDVPARLREARTEAFSIVAAADPTKSAIPLEGLLRELRKLEGVVLLCEPGRKSWWEERRGLLEQLGATVVCEARLPHKEWGRGTLADFQAEAIGQALSGCKQIWVESPEAAWFLASGVKQGAESLHGEVRVVWQRFFAAAVAREPAPDEVFHESFHLTRLFPRLGYSIPMYERGLMPFHSGWNSWDCGGEGFYRDAEPARAKEIGRRFLEDVAKDGRQVKRIVCQSLSCLAHLRELTDLEVVYWLDEVKA